MNECGMKEWRGGAKGTDEYMLTNSRNVQNMNCNSKDFDGGELEWCVCTVV